MYLFHSMKNNLRSSDAVSSPCPYRPLRGQSNENSFSTSEPYKLLFRPYLSHIHHANERLTTYPGSAAQHFHFICSADHAFCNYLQSLCCLWLHGWRMHKLHVERSFCCLDQFNHIIIAIVRRHICFANCCYQQS